MDKGGQRKTKVEKGGQRWTKVDKGGHRLKYKVLFLSVLGKVKLQYWCLDKSRHLPKTKVMTCYKSALGKVMLVSELTFVWTKSGHLLTTKCCWCLDTSA